MGPNHRSDSSAVAFASEFKRKEQQAAKDAADKANMSKDEIKAQKDTNKENKATAKEQTILQAAHC